MQAYFVETEMVFVACEATLISGDCAKMTQTIDNQETGGEAMYGAIIGDMVGSAYERRRDRIKTKEFPLFKENSRFTDDTVLTVAVGNALIRACCEEADFSRVLVEEMQRMGREYLDAGFSENTKNWILSSAPQPYGSSSNGAAMRVSPCGLMAVALEEALMLAEESAKISHDHPEGIKAAKAVAAAVYLAKEGRKKEEIAAYLREHFYPLNRSLEEIRPAYCFDMTCQGSVPEAIQCFLESDSYEDAIRNAVSLGGNADTQAAIAGSIAWTYYMGSKNVNASREEWPEEFRRLSDQADARLPKQMVNDMKRFHDVRMHRMRAFDRIGTVRPIVNREV